MDEMQSFEYLEAVETWLRAVCVRFPLSWEMLCDSEWNETLCHSYMVTASSEKGVDIMKPLRVFFYIAAHLTLNIVLPSLGIS